MDLDKNTSTFVVKDKQEKLIDSTKIPTEPSAVKGYLKQFPNAPLVVEPVFQWHF